jgi:hypothetical protein
MALERKDVRSKLDPPDHRRLEIVVNHDGQDIGEWVEQLILRELDRREAAARRESSLVDALDSLGKSGKNRESPGTKGSPET